jgi:hypothetical protein
MTTYGLQCPLGAHRLKVGIPATLQHGRPLDQPAGSDKAIVEAAAGFITTMDAIKMNQVSNDVVYFQLQTLVSDLGKVRCGADDGCCFMGGKGGSSNASALSESAVILTVKICGDFQWKYIIRVLARYTMYVGWYHTFIYCPAG